MEQQLMTVGQVAEKLGYHPDTVRKMARESKIPMFRIVKGSDWRITNEEFSRWLKERQVNG